MTFRKALFGALALLAASFPAHAKEKISFAYLLDPIYEAFVYPIKAGKVSSTQIEVEASAISVPASIQAVATKQYDVLTASAFSLPEAVANGIDLRILSVSARNLPDGEGVSLWVKSDSPYRTPADLKGKTIAISGYSAASATLARLVLADTYGLDVSFENGDLQWVVLASAAQPTALATQSVDASTLLHTLVNKASEEGGVRPILTPTSELHAKHGIDIAHALLVGYPERLAERPEAFREFNRLLKASVDYTLANKEEVVAAVAGDGVSADFLDDWLSRVASFPAVVSDGDIRSLEVTWELAKEIGIYSEIPDAAAIVWDGAIRTP